MAKYSLQECTCHIFHFIERGWMNVQLCFAYLLFETINMSTPFFSIPSITQLNGAAIFWTSLVSLKRESSITNPKNAPGSSRANPNKNLPATLYIKFDFVSPQYGQLNGSLSNLPFTSNQLIQPPYRLSPALTRGHGDLHLNGQLLGGCWWPIHITCATNWEANKSSKVSWKTKVVSPHPCKIIFWLLIQRNSLRNCVKPLCKSCEKLKPPVFLSEKRTTAINRMATWSIFNREKLWIHCLNTSHQPREIWRILLQTFSNSESYQTWALGQ